MSSSNTDEAKVAPTVEDVGNLELSSHSLEEEIKRLSVQVLKLSAEKDAYEKHAKLLGETLRQVRKSAAEHHIKEEDLGEDLQSKLNLKPEDVVGIVESVAQDEYPHLAALRLTAQENGWLIDPSELKLGKKIGEGATANIFAAEWHGLPVAVKCIKEGYLQKDKHAVESFIQEVELLIRQRHPFVLRLFGASLIFPTSCWIVSEILTKGTLTEWLHGEKARQWNRKTPLPPLKERLRMGLEVSLAMQYLHEQSPKVIHRDLKPSNIFIDSNNHTRLADFGFARFLKPDQSLLTGETGTYMYMAPEVIKHEHYDETCDVYSFGVMLNELLSGSPPFIETYLTPIQMAVAVADGSLRPKLASGVDSSLTSLVQSCWSQEMKKRPSFAEISTLLKSHIEAIERKETEVAAKDHKGGMFGFMHHYS